MEVELELEVEWSYARTERQRSRRVHPTHAMWHRQLYCGGGPAGPQGLAWASNDCTHCCKPRNAMTQFDHWPPWPSMSRNRSLDNGEIDTPV